MLKISGLYNKEAFIMNADAQNLLFEDETFDVVYSLGVLHHIPDTQ